MSLRAMSRPQTAASAASGSPVPGVAKTSWLPCRSRNATPGYATANCPTTSTARASSVGVLLRNFRRAGVLKNRSATSIVVPSRPATSSTAVMSPPSTESRAPLSSSAGLVVRVMRDTEAMEGSASPRKPSVRMANRSSAERILLVAWRCRARTASLQVMPQPLSATRIRCLPPSSSPMTMCVAPASIAFSTNSLTAEAGRSTTSPAAIRLAVFSSSNTMRSAAMPSLQLKRHHARLLGQHGVQAIAVEIAGQPHLQTHTPHRLGPALSSLTPRLHAIDHQAHLRQLRQHARRTVLGLLHVHFQQAHRLLEMEQILQAIQDDQRRQHNGGGDDGQPAQARAGPDGQADGRRRPDAGRRRQSAYGHSFSDNRSAPQDSDPDDDIG